MAGLKLRRQNNTIAIDANYFNMALRQKGSIATVAAGQTNPYVRKAEFTLAADQPFLAIRSPIPMIIIASTVNGNGTVTYTMFGVNTSANDFVFDFWLFDLPQYGMLFASAGKFIVRQPGTGRVVFDSRMKYLKVQDFFVPSGNDEARNYGRLPAIVFANRLWARVVAPMSPTTTREQTATSAGWTNGNTVYTGMRDIYFIIRQAYPSDRYINYSGGNAQTMVIDVQDY